MCTRLIFLDSHIFESLRLRVENENESFYEKIESRDREWDESLPWESQFRDRDESLAEVCTTLMHRGEEIAV